MGPHINQVYEQRSLHGPTTIIVEVQTIHGNTCVLKHQADPRVSVDDLGRHQAYQAISDDLHDLGISPGEITDHGRRAHLLAK